MRHPIGHFPNADLIGRGTCLCLVVADGKLVRLSYDGTRDLCLAIVSLTPQIALSDNWSCEQVALTDTNA
jgi:hypothetical protein